jgi:formamidopyrimidine-DNA glycosylase
MPELPEVETVRLGLAKHVIGKKILRVEVLHPRATATKSLAPLSSLAGAKIKGVSRRGKFLWFDLDRPEVLVAHLGMSGQFLISNSDSKKSQVILAPVRHLRVRIDLGRTELRFIDQRTFGWLAVENTTEGVPTAASHIALDPFDPNFDLEIAIARFSGKRTEIKRALLDQEVISGVGNIYADETLWRSKVHPETRCEKMKPAKIREVILNATKVMKEALTQGGTSFDELYINVNGESGYFARSLAVYGREGESCPKCHSAIRRIRFANRSSHFCPKCQPRPRA